MGTFSITVSVICASLFITASVTADSLYSSETFKAYAADHRASRIGDSVTILIYETSRASSNADSDGSKSLGAGFDYNTTNDNRFGNVDFGVSQEDERATQRQGDLRAQITAVVEEKDDLGRLRITGSQEISVNGEKQVIKIHGWVRNVDISPLNTVLSTRLSDASIEYAGDNLDGLEGNGGILRRVGNIVMWIPSKALDLTNWLLGVL